MCASNDIKNAKVKLIVDIVQKYINRYDKYLLFSRFYGCESRNFDYLGHWQCVLTFLLCVSSRLDFFHGRGDIFLKKVLAFNKSICIFLPEHLVFWVAAQCPTLFEEN